MFSKNSKITIKHEISGKSNLYSRSIDFFFLKNFKTIDKDKVVYYKFRVTIKQYYHIV